MSLDIHPFIAPAAATVPDRRPSPGLRLSLASNNPFRDRAASPASLPTEFSASSPFYTPPIDQNNRPASGNKNPFFNDSEEVIGVEQSTLPSVSIANSTTIMSSSQQPAIISHVTHDMNNLRFNGVPRPNGTDRSTVIPSHDQNKTHNGSTGIPPTTNGTREVPLSGGHGQTRSNEDEIRPHRNGGVSPPMKSRPLREPRPFVEQGDLRANRDNRPQRRNSESSVIGVRAGNVNDSEGRRPRGDGRHRERRHVDGRPREGGSKPKRTNQRLDIIDKLDVTSIYGTGLFHHDGPFDACNPHRNRKGSSRAPMQAFAKDSANNVLGGSGPLHKDIDHAQYFGDRAAEAFSDFSKSGVESRGYELYGGNPSRPTVDRSNSFNPVSRVDPVHGDESLGLGTSTFLEGAPASRTAIQRRESESEGNNTKGGDGLTRKKSLAQRIRGLNQNRQFGGGSSSGTRIKSPDRKYGQRSPREYHNPTASTPTSAGGTTKINEGNPFFSDYDAAYNQKGESIAVAGRGRAGHVQVPSSPKTGLERRITHDAAVGVRSEENNKPTGFLSRVRSLRGGRRQQKVV